MKPKILITRKIPEEVIGKFKMAYDVTVWEYEDKPIPYEILQEKIVEVGGLLCMLTDTIDEKLLSRAKKLKVISNMAVGYNNIDIDVATRRNIIVTNTPGILTETTADLTFALLMATARRITEGSEYLKAGKWKTWSPMLLTGQDIYGKTLGIIGLGRIGEAVARRAKGFDMKIYYHNRSRKQEVEENLGIEYTSFNHLLEVSDYVVLLTPYTPATKDMITKKQLKLMKNNAILTNTSRGGIVNEEDLYQALVNGDIWAAGLDVFQEEPVPMNHPLLSLSNVVVLPHIGSASVKTRMRMAHVAAENVIQVLENNIPANTVN